MLGQASEVGPDAAALQESVKTAATVSRTENEIATAAYRLWQERGCPHGSDQEDWFRAEATLKNALVVKCEDPFRGPSISCCDPGTDSETLAELVSEGWQEGHWEVWEREWVSARWVRDVLDSGVGVSNRARFSGKAA